MVEGRFAAQEEVQEGGEALPRGADDFDEGAENLECGGKRQRDTALESMPRFRREGGVALSLAAALQVKEKAKETRRAILWLFLDYDGRRTSEGYFGGSALMPDTGLRCLS